MHNSFKFIVISDFRTNRMPCKSLIQMPVIGNKPTTSAFRKSSEVCNSIKDIGFNLSQNKEFGSG